MFVTENNMTCSTNFNQITATILYMMMMMMMPTLTQMKLCTFKVTAHRNKQGRDLKHMNRRKEIQFHKVD